MESTRKLFWDGGLTEIGAVNQQPTTGADAAGLILFLSRLIYRNALVPVVAAADPPFRAAMRSLACRGIWFRTERYH